MSYSLIDSGDEYKLERFGEYLIARPCSQAIWRPLLSKDIWKGADAIFTREKGNKWSKKAKLPSSWNVEIEDILFKIAPTDFGHLGVFPEHSMLWKWIGSHIEPKKAPQVLNLFAYSGGATLAMAKAGAKVCHLDASKGMVTWARENAALNKLEKAPIRWIVEDVLKFLGREVKRGVQYDGIILDPPSFGRGNRGEVFKIEKDLQMILDLCRKLLSKNPLFVVLTSHTLGFTPIVMGHLMSQMMEGFKGKIDTGEMILKGKNALDVPSGCFARWSHAR